LQEKARELLGRDILEENLQLCQKKTLLLKRFPQFCLAKYLPMGKSGKNRKKRKLAAATASMPLTQSIDDDSLSIDDDELQITVGTLKALACPDRRDEFFSKRLKPLRAELYNLLNAGLIIDNKKNSSSSSISGSTHERICRALKEASWGEAIELLTSLTATPKLGSVQRWVRECDGVFGHLDSQTLSMESTCLTVLDMILRKSAPNQIGLIRTHNSEGVQELAQGAIREIPSWRASEREVVRDIDFHDSDPIGFERGSFRVCLAQEGKDRVPENQYPISIWCSDEKAHLFDTRNNEALGTNSIAGPFSYDNGADAADAPFMINNLMTTNEAFDLIRVGSKLGFAPDAPINDKNSILAHAFVYLLDQKDHDVLWQRCEHLIPREYNPVGLNRRFRCYRYVKGATYRPHIDGAWPGSGLSSDGDYVYDSYGDRLSRFTFLIYLNEDFTGGETKFYAPNGEKVGVLDRRGVTPMCGSALVFPHGDTKGALLHEGSGVESGTKYVVRTEVLCKT